MNFGINIYKFLSFKSFLPWSSWELYNTPKMPVNLLCDSNTRVSQKVMLFFFSTRIIINTGTCIIHQNEAGSLWIISLLLNIVTISFNSNVPPLNESMYLCLIKFCWLFFVVDFLPRGETINSEAYIETLTRLRAKIQGVRPNLSIKNVLFLHDNARPSTNIRTRETIALFGWTTLPHPPYSPDLAPSDYHLFSPIKGLRSKHYASEKEVKTAVLKWLKEQHIYTQTYTQSYIYIYIYINVCVYIYIYICINVCAYIYIYIYMHTFIYIYIYIYINIYIYECVCSCYMDICKQNKKWYISV